MHRLFQGGFFPRALLLGAGKVVYAGLNGGLRPLSRV
jgi:hypothetical protein